MNLSLETLQPLIDLSDAMVITAVAIFVRISAIVFLLPGFGEQFLPARIKLGVALAFAAVSWPLILPQATMLDARLEVFGYAFLAEAAAGLVIGFSVRLMLFALQIAGTMAAQSLSISQIFGAGIAPDPQPTIATFLTMGGVTLAMALGLHVKAALLIVESYQALPFGVFPFAEDVGAWTTQRIAQSFSLAVSLALPFIMVAFVYNLAIGFINRAMPQLMVTFIGMPFITWMGMLLLSFTAVAVITFWHARFDEVLFAPLALRN